MFKRKKVSVGALAFVFVLSLFIQPSMNGPLSDGVAQANSERVVVNGEQIDIPAGGLQTENGRILVPFRAISEALGIDVTWNQSARQVTAQDGGTTAVFTIDQPYVEQNGVEESLDTAPTIHNNRTLIPLRYFSETFGAEVNWDHNNQVATVDRQTQQPEPPSEEPGSDVEGVYTATTTPANLNVRSGPGVEHNQITGLPSGTTVEVLDFEGQWAQIEAENVDGWVHSNYLDLQGDNSDGITLLGEPEIETSGTETVVTWPKIGGSVDISPYENTYENGTVFSLRAEAAEIAMIDNSIEGIVGVHQHGGEEQTTLDMTLADGYEVEASASNGYVTATISEASSGGGNETILVDAGHGGRDSGATGYGMTEKEFVLDVSLHVEEMLEDMGYDVVMTREGDYFVELAERVSIAEQANADSFVSVHANSFNGTAHGSETFWHPNHNAEESRQLAQSIQNHLIEKLQTHNRGIKEGNFHVIRETTMPSALVEVAFIDNAADAERMAQDWFRVLAAEAIVEGIDDFHS
ncbi:N-acetylmuramoyl-L-alanine amidase [Salsuginibacillus kocurii]|uniref:N-acetylmuramoyl-L-alanine amidase n=1 Tax=Salsuginibacillus kocurii TaxID=427078 RepID=UPI00035DFECD|nr:N-acetylmuramoyl-L-alanine amidase [Salsuginibacillus kocurii]